jgi:hypothetical protein
MEIVIIASRTVLTPIFQVTDINVPAGRTVKFDMYKKTYEAHGAKSPGGISGKIGRERNSVM